MQKLLLHTQRQSVAICNPTSVWKMQKKNAKCQRMHPKGQGACLHKRVYTQTYTHTQLQWHNIGLHKNTHPFNLLNIICLFLKYKISPRWLIMPIWRGGNPNTTILKGWNMLWTDWETVNPKGGRKVQMGVKNSQVSDLLKYLHSGTCSQSQLLVYSLYPSARFSNTPSWH